MIRSAKVPDIWRDIDKNSFRYYINEVNLNGLLGLTEPIKLNKGIFSICGLNGVGKSTLLAAIKDVLGIAITDRERIKLQNTIISATFKDGNNAISLQNNSGNRLIDHISEDIILEYIDYQKIVEINDFIHQTNFYELVDQFEDNIFDNDDIQTIEYLVGKSYDNIILREIEVEDDYIIPFFQVDCNGMQYDSLTMGTGEHFLFYIFWMFKRINNKGIILIEEPEVFISVNSQMNLMNFIANQINTHRFSAILVTHSPFILKNINSNRMLILNNYLDSFDVQKPQNKEVILEDLGLKNSSKGSLIFEDRLAMEFFISLSNRHYDIILKNYSLEYVEGYSNISKILSIPKLSYMKYSIIGFYDADMKESSKIDEKSLNLKYFYLPGENCLEEDFKQISRNKFVLLSSKLNIAQKDLRNILGKIQGYEKHDWLIEFVNAVKIEYSSVVNIFTQLWEEDNSELISAFIDHLKKL